VLGMLYPRSYMAFLALMFLDIFSHWWVKVCPCEGETPALSGAVGCMALLLKLLHPSVSSHTR
jgi:hypothetical protein